MSDAKEKNSVRKREKSNESPRSLVRGGEGPIHYKDGGKEWGEGKQGIGPLTVGKGEMTKSKNEPEEHLRLKGEKGGWGQRE